MVTHSSRATRLSPRLLSNYNKQHSMDIVKKVEQESVRQLAVREQMSAKSSWLGYGLQAAVLWQKFPSVWVGLWLASVAAFEGLNWLLARWMLQGPVENRQRWHARLPVTLACAGASWSCLVFVPGATNGLELVLFNLLVLAVVAIISVHNLSLSPRALLAFSAGMCMPVAIYFLWGAGASPMIGLATCALCLMVQLYGRMTRKLVVGSMTARLTQERTAKQLALRNAELAKAIETIQELADTDPLTHCLNRRAGLERIEAEQIRAQRQQVPFGVILIDVDFFKHVNDAHGHATGDLVLVNLADVIRSVLRARVDSLVRWGGEEFLCVLSASDEAALLAKAHVLRAAIAAKPMGVPGAPLSVTASLGVAAYRTGESVDTMVDHADQALYRAKHDGRNRVACYSAQAQRNLDATQQTCG